jgi:uncharacterized protein
MKLGGHRSGSPSTEEDVQAELSRGFGDSTEVIPAPNPQTAGHVPQRLVVFSKTAGYRHDSIPDGVAALHTLGERRGLAVQATEDAAELSRLEDCAGVVFLSTSGTVLGEQQRTALESYVRGGGAFLGVHAASATEYDWPFYGELVGARFLSHPEVQPAAVHAVDEEHPATRHLAGRTWWHTDEWYDYHAVPGPQVRTLLTVEESTYSGGLTGSPHPLAWCREIGAGRSFYTALGHTPACYTDPDFLAHLEGGLTWILRTDD